METESESPAPGEAGGAGGAATSNAGGAPDSAGAPAVGGAAGSAGAASGDGGSSGEAVLAGGAGGASAEPPHITSSITVVDMTVEQFTELCDARGGTVEVMAHCNGLATGKGFSYDSSVDLLSEHTCVGANTCEGWNCLLD